MKKIIVILLSAFVATMATALFCKTLSAPKNDVFEENIEALSEGELNQPIWERYYRNDLEYNCAKPGNETC